MSRGNVRGVQKIVTELRNNRADSVELLSPRSSKRLAKGAKTSILQRAITRKANQREGMEESGVGRSVKSLIRKSRLCGVSLGEVKARNFKEFVSKRA